MIPPEFMSSAARKKNGIASRRYWSVPAAIRCATAISGTSPAARR
jgi:hypothetical protein